MSISNARQSDSKAVILGTLFLILSIHKECSCEGIVILCSDKGLQSIPQIVSTNTAGLTSLEFEMNQITVIPAGSLPPNLTELSLEYNPITTIDETAFDGSANTLELLTFSNARFTKIPAALLHLKNLNHLQIYDSSILEWDVDIMKHISLTLETLYLRNAGILTRPSWIQYFSNLTELYMDNCFVSDLPDNALDMVIDKLMTLSLFNNSLTEVPKALSKLNLLMDLNLGNNQIANITWLPQSKLYSLILNNNNISDGNHLRSVLLSYADTLTSVSLQVNKLTTIPNLEFLIHVGEFDFTYNRIVDPYSGSLPPDLFELDLRYNFLPAIPRVLSNLPHLSDMMLSSNAINEINGTDFPPNVVTVWLVYNMITELTDTSFPPNSKIQFLHLNNNPINKISVLAFKRLHSLTYLNLRETKITRLPLALASLASLVFFDATDSTDLVCTCAEKSLRPLFVSLLPGSVRGDCGQTSIYNFFTILSSGCPTQ